MFTLITQEQLFSTEVEKIYDNVILNKTEDIKFDNNVGKDGELLQLLECESDSVIIYYMINTLLSDTYLRDNSYPIYVSINRLEQEASVVLADVTGVVSWKVGSNTTVCSSHKYSMSKDNLGKALLSNVLHESEIRNFRNCHIVIESHDGDEYIGYVVIRDTEDNIIKECFGRFYRSDYLAYKK